MLTLLALRYDSAAITILITMTFLGMIYQRYHLTIYRDRADTPAQATPGA